MIIINGDGGCRFWQPVQADSQPKSSGLVLGLRPLGAVLHSLNELGELLQCLCHDDSTINIVLDIIIIIIIIIIITLQYAAIISSTLAVIDIVQGQICPADRQYNHRIAHLDVIVEQIVHIHNVIIIVLVVEKDVRDAACRWSWSARRWSNVYNNKL